MHRRPGKVASPPRGRPADPRRPAPGRGHRASVLSAVARALGVTPRRAKQAGLPGSSTADQTGGIRVQIEELPVSQVLNLRVGEIVEVRSEAEILATLDARSELESLPFMPEMLQFCGRRFRVDKLAVKLCDTIGSTGMYRMRNAVHLEGVRCDGQAHGGCQAGCLVYWKEAWLKRVPVEGHDRPDPAPEPAAAGCTHATLLAATRKAGTAPDDGRFSCQATELLRAAPTSVPPWDVGQYVLDVRSGNASLLATIRAVAIGLFNEYQDLSRRLLPQPLRIRGGVRFPFIEGRLERTPDGTLGLQPGELVRIKSKQQIVGTLDVNNSNRGLSFDPEMLWYCGRQARVLRRIEQTIDERTGKLLRLKRPCVVLEGVTCRGEFHRCCPRADYPYWREVWLERVE